MYIQDGKKKKIRTKQRNKKLLLGSSLWKMGISLDSSLLNIQYITQF